VPTAGRPSACRTLVRVRRNAPVSGVVGEECQPGARDIADPVEASCEYSKGVPSQIVAVWRSPIGCP
jgi:hypothetical protein